jgi:hypothetical protein
MGDQKATNTSGQPTVIESESAARLDTAVPTDAKGTSSITIECRNRKMRVAIYRTEFWSGGRL